MSQKQVLIIGSGIFGTSTGLALLKRGGYAVTILDKADELPALDAASTGGLEGGQGSREGCGAE